MYEIVSKFLWAADKFIPEIRLRHPGFTYSAWRAFTKKKKKRELKNLKKLEIHDILIKTN